MSNETLGLLFRATGDFSDVTQSATTAAREIQRQFGPQSALGKLGGEQVGLFQRIMGGKAARTQSDSNRIMNSVRDAIERTHQAGKRLRDLNLGGQFGEAAKHALAIQRSMDRAANTLGGRDLKRRVKASGQDWDRPHEWDWSRFGFGSAAAARRAQARFVGGDDEGGGGGGHQGGGGGGLGGRMGAWGLQQGRSALGTIAGLAVGGGIVSAIVAASREDFRRVEGIDSAHKGLAGTRTFEDVKNEAVALGKALQMAGSEAAEMASSFVRTSGALDTKVFERIDASGKFGRGFGLKPDVTTELFGQAEKVGYGTSKQGQREFAALLAQTIAGSGMFAKSDQVMGDLVGHISNIASSQGRTASTEEMSVFGNFMEQLYENKALRGGGAQNILGQLGKVGSGDDMVSMNFAWNAFGDAARGDIIDVMRMAKAGPTQSMDSLHPGRGFSKTTRAELADAAIRNIYAPMGPAKDDDPEKDRQNYIWASGQYLGLDANIAGAQYDFMKQFKPAGQSGSHGDYVAWAKGATGKDLENIAMDGHMRLSKLWSDKDKPLAERKDTLLDMGTEYQADSRVTGTLKTNLDEAMRMAGERQARELSTLLPKIIAETGSPEDEARHAREAQASLTNGLGDLGKIINDLILVLKDPIGPALSTIARWLGGGVDTSMPAGTPPADVPIIMEGRQERHDEREANTRRAQSDPLYWSHRRTGTAAVLDTIAFTESGRNPNAVQGDQHQSEVDFTRKTVREVIAWQREHGDKAVGLYQFKPDTLEEQAKKAGPGYMDAHFNEGIQSALAEQYAKKHGLNEWLNGEGTSDDLLNRLAPVWRGVSGTDGNTNFSRPGALIGLDRARPPAPARQPAQPGAPAQPLSQLVRDPAALAAARSVTPRTNGCATFASSILQQAGVPIETIPGAQNLSDRLGRMGWQRIDVGDQRPGDVGVTEDHGQGAPGADHVYLVQSVDPDDPNQMRVVDNQRPMGGARAARGRGSRTPTSHFWRAPPPMSPISDAGTPPGAPTSMAAPPKMPPDLDRAIGSGTTPDAINARWQGQIAMDLTFRDARGNVVQRRNAMTVSEPRLAGSGGNGPGLDRFSWNDSVTMPAFA